MNAWKPDLLCIGFACHDLHQANYLLGGTASYSSIMASHLGLKTALLTSVGKDFKFHAVFAKHSIAVSNKLAGQTTLFENIYHEKGRTQYLHHRAEVLEPVDVPDEWLEVPIVKFCLIADEVSPSFLNLFPHALVGATIQGWLRQWDELGKISPKTMNWDLLEAVDIVFMSEEDIATHDNALAEITRRVGLVLMTKGPNGAMVFHGGQSFFFPSFPVEEVDPTGAGDIFAASFLVHYKTTQSIPLSAAFAHASASFIVENYGIQLPSIEAIDQRYRDYVARFFGE